MANIQDFFSDGQDKIDIPPGEYAGPLIIRHSCTVDGHGATLWSKIGAALVVEASFVTIKNLRVELVMKTDDFIAIEILSPNVHLENVEVYGEIRRPNSLTSWNLPRTINFGCFAANEKNEFLVKLTANENCRIINSVYGLTVEPQILTVGENDVRFSVEAMRDGMILYGDLLLETSKKILRRIFISGRAKNGAEIKRLNSEAHVQKKDLRESPPTVTEKDVVPKKNRKRREPKSAVNTMKKGQRIFAPHAEKFFVAFKAASLPTDMTIDACAFCLGDNEKVLQDSDVIFFNNPRHESLSVCLGTKDSMPGIDLNLKTLPQSIKAVVVCFAIYDVDNRSSNNFSKVSSPEVIVYANEKVSYEFPLDLRREKVFTALEFYRRQDAWKINFIGAGFVGGLEKLCELYGVEVF